MLVEFEKQLSQTLEEIKSQGLYKTERIITTPQDAHIAVAIGQRDQSAAALPIFGGLPTATARAVYQHGCRRAKVGSGSGGKRFNRGEPMALRTIILPILSWRHALDHESHDE